MTPSVAIRRLDKVNGVQKRRREQVVSASFSKGTRKTKCLSVPSGSETSFAVMIAEKMTCMEDGSTQRRRIHVFTYSCIHLVFSIDKLDSVLPRLLDNTIGHDI